MSTDLIEFLQIKHKFLLFLNDKDCLYKFCQNYINTICDHIDESIEKLIEEQLLNYILFIKKESTTYCPNNYLKLQSNSEIEIITESQKLLKKIKNSNQ
jgi:hypothetical protein